MANTLTNILPKLLARGLMTLREQACMPRIVNMDYGQEAAMKGATIDVPVPVAKTASSVTPSNTPPAPSNATPNLVQVPLDNWEHCDFHLTDKELMEIDQNRHFIPMEMAEAIRALANAVNTDLMSEYVGVYNVIGTAGTTPFGRSSGEDLTDPAVDAGRVLLENAAPQENRRLVVDPFAGAEAKKMEGFAHVEKAGDGDVKIEAQINRKYGFDWFEDQGVVQHTAGSLAAGETTVTGANSVGATTINLTNSGSGAYSLVVGDIISFAGDSQTYVVTAATGSVGNSATGDVTISPALAVATSGSEVVTLTASHRVNLAFHRDAFAFANRPLSSAVSSGLGSEIAQLTDPKTGISLRLEVSRQYKQNVWDFDILWGAKLVRPELAVRVMG